MIHFIKLEITSMSIKQLTAITGLLLAAITNPAQINAHHAFGAEFDANRPLTLEGKVSRIEWVNPHAWFIIDVANEDGTETEWWIEGGTPNTLLRRGIHKRSIRVGTEVMIEGYQAKDRSNRANGRNITLAGGEKLFMGSSGTGAPQDGADPTEQ